MGFIENDPLGFIHGDSVACSNSFSEIFKFLLYCKCWKSPLSSGMEIFILSHCQWNIHSLKSWEQQGLSYVLTHILLEQQGQALEQSSSASKGKLWQKQWHRLLRPKEEISFNFFNLSFLCGWIYRIWAWWGGDYIKVINWAINFFLQ